LKITATTKENFTAKIFCKKIQLSLDFQKKTDKIKTEKKMKVRRKLKIKNANLGKSQKDALSKKITLTN
jgi:hypothetical protein